MKKKFQKSPPKKKKIQKNIKLFNILCEKDATILSMGEN